VTRDSMSRRSNQKTYTVVEEETETIPSLDDLLNIFVVGDIHFQKDAFVQGEELIEKLVDAATTISPTIIILLGDILDNHETVRNSQFKQAERLLDSLRQIAPVYVLMGNHDLINQSQFLTDAHFFGPFKKWDKVTIVDVPMAVTLTSSDREINVVMCPYVPPGKFIEALNTLFEYEEPVDWQLADCIFGHQEIRGVTYNGRESTKGDQWDENYPPLICGHIHKSCQIGTNVYYVGSARQVASNEEPDKRIWSITFDDEGFQKDEIDLGLKARKEIEMEYEEVKFFDFSLLEQYHIKLKIQGTREQFKLFRKSQLHAKLTQQGVRIAFNPVIETGMMMVNLAEALKDDVSFESILRELVKTKPKVVRDVYEEMYGSLDMDEDLDTKSDSDHTLEVDSDHTSEVLAEGENEMIYELVFIDGH